MAPAQSLIAVALSLRDILPGTAQAVQTLNVTVVATLE
jgi:hypothetical protein